MKEKIYCIKVFIPDTEKMGEWTTTWEYVENMHDWDRDDFTSGWSRDKELAEKFAKYLCGLNNRPEKRQSMFPKDVLDEFEFWIAYTNEEFDSVQDPFYVEEIYDDTSDYCDPIEVEYPWFVK